MVHMQKVTVDMINDIHGKLLWTNGQYFIVFNKLKKLCTILQEPLPVEVGL